MRPRRSRLIVLALAVLVLAVVAAACTPPPPPPLSPAGQDMVTRHNAARQDRSLGALSVDGEMMRKAQFHADRLVAGVTSCSAATMWHSGELQEWYGGYSAGENVACIPGCPSDAQRAFDLWVDSPGHAANVFNPAYVWTAVGVACNGSVQMVAHYRSA